MKTLNAEQLELLNQPLPAEAKKPHPTKKFLTTINPIYVTERLNQVFGVGAWKIHSEAIKMHADAMSGAVKMVVVKTTLSIPEYGIEYECYGGNDNPDLGDAFKGAVTDAITKIGSWMGIGVEVWKNMPHIVPAPVTAPPKAKQKQVINDALLDNPARCNKMLEFLKKAYKANPDSFQVIDYLISEGWEFEDCADQRVMAIWMHEIANNDL